MDVREKLFVSHEWEYLDGKRDGYLDSNVPRPAVFHVTTSHVLTSTRRTKSFKYAIVVPEISETGSYVWKRS